MTPAADARLADRILTTLAYAGLFGAGLTPAELRQRLFGAGAATADEVAAGLAALNGRSGRLSQADGRYFLAGTPSPSAPHPDDWPGVRAWAAAAAAIPFVRFIGLTGARAKGAPDADLDVFVVAAAGRGYLAFALLKTAGRWLAARHGLRLCLNFLVEDGALAVRPRDAFTATEFVTMIPLTDDGVQARLWAENADWVTTLCGCARPADPAPGPGRWARMVRTAGEAALGGRAGAWLNRLVFRAKRRRVERQLGRERLAGPDVVIEPGYFKQHTRSHRALILERFALRLEELGLDAGWVAPPR